MFFWLNFSPAFRFFMAKVISISKFNFILKRRKVVISIMLAIWCRVLSLMATYLIKLMETYLMKLFLMETYLMSKGGDCWKYDTMYLLWWRYNSKSARIMLNKVCHKAYAVLLRRSRIFTHKLTFQVTYANLRSIFIKPRGITMVLAQIIERLIIYLIP